MKPVYKCDYCNFMGTKEVVEKHEPECWDNYDMRSCFTCEHRDFEGLAFKCDAGIEIPENHVYKFCESYERKERVEFQFSDIFGGFGK